MKSGDRPTSGGASMGYQGPKLFLSLVLPSSSYYLLLQSGCWSVSHHIHVTGSRLEEEGKDSKSLSLAELALFKTLSQKPCIALGLASMSPAGLRRAATPAAVEAEDESCS